MRFNYSKADLSSALKQIIFDEHQVVFVSGNLARLGVGDFKGKQEQLDYLLECIQEVAGEFVTVVTSTFTHDIVNTEIPFDLYNTKSMHGVIANYFLKHPGHIRSNHPFTSFAAIGPNAEFICGEDLQFPYGIDSPYDRMMKLKNPLTISIGMPPNLTCSIVHHAEFNMHVPYRYIKEFNHPVMKEGKVVRENYYLPVVYRGMEIKRNKNVNIFEEFKKSNQIKRSDVGKGKIYGYRMNDLYDSIITQMKKDIYCWLDEPPLQRPYQE